MAFAFASLACQASRLAKCCLDAGGRCQKSPQMPRMSEQSARGPLSGRCTRRAACGALVSLFPLLLAACVGAGTSSEPGAAFLLAVDVPQEAAAGAALVDVRGPTERRRDGLPKHQHHWIPFGADRWMGGASEQRESFLREVLTILGPASEAPRLIIICSVGVRSEAAARILAAAGYDASNLQDGWIGNDMGPGLRSVEQDQR